MNINWTWLGIIGKRFLKAFVFGGLTAMVVQMAQYPQLISSFGDLRMWFFTLVYAFIVGGVMAMEKASQGYNPQ